jgi:pimeloyl-ACP methyl ester carboxylesterase
MVLERDPLAPVKLRSPLSGTELLLGEYKRRSAKPTDHGKTAPETHYAQNGHVRIAYQIVGEGDVDLLLVPGLVSHLGLIWEEPEYAAFCRRLAEFSRLILFDKRGTGLSDRRSGIGTIDERIADIRAVMDAAAVRRPVMFGFSEGGKTALLFAAAYPESIRALALYGAFSLSPTRAWAPDQVETRFKLMERAWGVPLLPPSVAPSKASDQGFRRRWARFEARSANAATAGALLRLDHDLDVGPILPAIGVPTLILHRSGDRRIAVEYGRELAAGIPRASYLEMPGVDHLFYLGDSERVIGAVHDFIVAQTRQV